MPSWHLSRRFCVSGHGPPLARLLRQIYVSHDLALAGAHLEVSQTDIIPSSSILLAPNSSYSNSGGVRVDPRRSRKLVEREIAVELGSQRKATSATALLVGSADVNRARESNLNRVVKPLFEIALQIWAFRLKEG